VRTKEERIEARRAAVRKYKASPKYKAWFEEYRTRPDVKRRNLESVRRWQAKPGVKEKLAPGKRAFNLKDKYGLTVEQYDAMLEAQGGVCATCGKPCDRRKRLAVDHAHETRKVRGLLCERCNLALGLLGEDPETISRMAEYVRRHV
jgi:hypothetical protein